MCRTSACVNSYACGSAVDFSSCAASTSSSASSAADLLQPRHLRRDVEAHRLREQRRHVQQPPRRLAEAAEAALDHLAHRVGNAHRLDRHRGAPAPALADQRPLFDQMQQHLANEERIAAGLPGDRGDQCRWHLLVGDRCEQLLHGGRVEAGERDLLVARLARQRAEGVAQRMLAVDLDVAVGAEDEQPPAPGKARHVAQHRHGPMIRPVQIVDHHHRRRAGRQRQEHTAPRRRAAAPALRPVAAPPARADRAAARAAPAPRASAGRRRARGRPAGSRPARAARTRSAPRRRGRTAAPLPPRSSGPRAPSPPRRAPSRPAPPACASCRCPPRLPATPRRRGRRGRLAGVGRGEPAPPCGRRTASASAAPPARPAGTAPRTP